AHRQIEQITPPVVRVSVSNFFLPGSEIQYHLNWRNVKRIDLSLYPVDLTKDVSFQKSNARSRSWLDRIDLAGREKVASWTFSTGDKGKHLPGPKALRLEKPIPTGAYVIEGVGGKKSSRDLVLVSDASLVLKTSGKQALVYVCDVLDGSPIPDARVRLWERGYVGSTWRWREETRTTSDEGLAVFDLVAPSRKGWRRTDLFVSAISKDRQAFSTGQSYSGQRSALSWKIYAFTDRPAYRPEETAHWKILARQYDGSIYSTPSGEEIEYQITDPRGAKVSEGTVSLNNFGSAWASLDLTGSMPLGEYKISFWTTGKKDGLGSASLFRLEEYKLPEFKVSVRTPEEDGRKRAFKLGESVEIEILAEYYFGGPVGNATVEVLVYQNPFYHSWSPPREFPWFYEDIDHRSRRHWWGSGQIIKHETIRTDELGRAKLAFDTPHNSNQDFEYRVEARVTDASRRQIVGSGKVRVTRQSYHVYLRPGHHLYRPQDKVTVDVRTIDANDQPLSTSGTITVTKDTYFEVWLDPNGREVSGDELKRMRSEMRHFPPRSDGPTGPGWRLKIQGYHHDEVSKRIVKTNADGEAELTFTPEREGYYQFVWASQDRDGSPISAQTTAWVATDASRDLGYRQGGVEIIVDKDTFRAGEKAAVMLTVPTNDRYVLFSIEGEDLYSYRLVHLEGTVKLLHLDIEERHVPNIYLVAGMVSDRQFHMDTKQIVVPPVDHFLSVEIKHDRETYQPQEEGTVTIKTRDRNGKPVSAEVSLGLVDESVYAIQSDYAGDPRKFFYGSKRRQIVRTRGTFNHKRFTKLALGDEERLIEVAVRDLYRREEGEKLGAKKEMKGKARADSSAEASGGRSRGGADRPSAPAEGMLAFNDASEEMEADGRGAFDPDSGGGVVVRSDFRSTVFWQPDVITDEDGHATATVKYPDTLTRWKATARVITEKNQFGIADSSTRTRKPLIARLQAPRFFVVGDLATVSAVINNNTEKKLTVTPSLKAKGLSIIGLLIDGQVKKGEAGPI
ncbi:MAG: MG2 domain-containing protein, partial [Planctomycetota bacterium]|nr:MG2 domain-containing protein [Planctomycetota bacterium]